MKQPTFCGRELLPLSVIEAARAGDPLAVERVLRYYEGYICLLYTSRRYQQTILMITHNKNLTASVDRVFRVSEIGRASCRERV